MPCCTVHMHARDSIKACWLGSIGRQGTRQGRCRRWTPGARDSTSWAAGAMTLQGCRWCTHGLFQQHNFTVWEWSGQRFRVVSGAHMASCLRCVRDLGGRGCARVCVALPAIGSCPDWRPVRKCLVTQGGGSLLVLCHSKVLLFCHCG